MIWLVVIGAAVAGAFLRAVASSTPQPWGVPRVVDTLMGGFASVAVWMLLGVLPWTAPSVAKLHTAIEQVISVAVLAFIGSHLWVNRGADWLAALGDRFFRGKGQVTSGEP